MTTDDELLAERPRLLDLFCGAGGAAKGYHNAGFEVIGVDIVDQPNYPFEFRKLDALKIGRYFESYIDAIHASPPCQFATAYRRRKGVAADAVNLIPQTRTLLKHYAMLGVPYVIENVEQAKDHLRNPVRLCGSSFGLNVRRHRLFECSFPIMVPPCDHSWQTPRFPPATNRQNLRSTVEVGVYRIPLAVQREAMGVDWMTLPELSQAIPPAYTEFIGGQLLATIGASRDG